MPAPDEEAVAAARNAKLAILQAIELHVRTGVTPAGLRDVAEAYALVTGKLSTPTRT